MSDQGNLFGDGPTHTSGGDFDYVGNAKAKDELDGMDAELSKLRRMHKRAEAKLAEMGPRRTLRDRERAEFKVQDLADKVAKQERAIAERSHELLKGAWA